MGDRKSDKKPKAKLEFQLEQWLGAGLVTQEQCEKILEFEAARVENAEHRLLKGLGALAALSIGLGVISVIAANWDLIGPNIKLSAYFFIFGGLSFLLTRIERLPAFLAEALSLAYLLLIPAGIGLIAQIYHIPQEGWRGLALWSALGLLPTLLLNRPKMSLAWLGIYVYALIAWVSHDPIQMSLRVDLFFLHWAILGLFCFHDASFRLPEGLRLWIRTLSLGFVLLVFPYSLFSGFGPEAVRSEGLALSVLVICWLGLPGFWHRLTPSQRSLTALGLLAFSLRCVLVWHYGSQISRHGVNLVETLAVLIQGTVMAILALQTEQDRWFEALGLLMALRVVILFLTLFGSLMVSGTGLIALGIGLLLLLKAWQKHRKALESLLRSLGR